MTAAALVRKPRRVKSDMAFSQGTWWLETRERTLPPEPFDPEATLVTAYETMTERSFGRAGHRQEQSQGMGLVRTMDDRIYSVNEVARHLGAGLTPLHCE